MLDPLLVLVIGAVVIAIATGLGPRLKIAGPLLLVIIGIGASFLPFIEVPAIDPEIILVGILPPLLYSAAISLPAIEFRRDFGPIAGLAVILVVLSSIGLAFFLSAVVPGLGFFLAFALGAILSPTDAVATAIAKRLGISRRVITMLDGESLLNDATSLVILRSAVAAAAVGSVNPGQFVGSFVWGVLIAIVVGAVVGYLNLQFRRWVGNTAANTAVGFVIPFAAYLPTEHLGGSGLVAAVVAGIVTGQGTARYSTPEQRLSDSLNWRTVETLLEGVVFLIMGLELKDHIEEIDQSDAGLWHAIWIAAAALGIILAIRGAYVAILVWGQSRRARRKQADAQRERLAQFSDRLDEIEESGEFPSRGRDERRAARPREPAEVEKRVGIARRRVSRALGDLDYYQASPLGWKHGTVIVWAGMRGVVTLAAAQTLPLDTPERSLLVVVAFFVAIGSFMLQGFTLPMVVGWLKLDGSGDDEVDRAEERALDDEMHAAVLEAVQKDVLRTRSGDPFPPEFLTRMAPRMSQPPDEEDTAMMRQGLELRYAMIDVMRARLNEAAKGGRFGTPALRHARAELDADQISLELRLEDED